MFFISFSLCFGQVLLLVFGVLLAECLSDCLWWQQKTNHSMEVRLRGAAHKPVYVPVGLRVPFLHPGCSLYALPCL